MSLLRMKDRLFQVFILLFAAVSIPVWVIAGGVADFSVGSKSKVTLNPAGAALVDRILFDFTVFTYEGGNQLSPFNNQFSDSGSSTYLHAAFTCGSYTCYDDVDYIQFENGETNGLHLDFAYPTPYFTIGISYDYRSERYTDGYFVSNQGSEYDDLDSNIKAEHEHNINSYFIAIPLDRLSFGYRKNHKVVDYKFTGFDAFGFYTSPGYVASTLFSIYNDGQIEGSAEYTYSDFGIIYHFREDRPLLDFSYLRRPSSTAKFKFKDLIIDGSKNHGTGVEMEDFEFTEPGIDLFGFNIATRSGNILTQLLLEAGNYLDMDESLDYLVKESKSNRDRSFDIIGYMARVAYHPIVDLVYGYKSHEIAGSLTEVTTLGAKFPFPFYPDLILSLGTSQTKVSDDEDNVVAENRSYAFSFELKIGKPVVKKGRRLAPKTKTLPPDFP